LPGVDGWIDRAGAEVDGQGWPDEAGDAREAVGGRH
jgi:hypothetical protein